MDKPLVSIVIPVYRVENYLDRCVGSVVDQTYRNLEIILVDDGSPDRCPELCDAWARRDPRIRVIHKENAGLGMARNSGMALAEGEYIFFFDSDDWVDPSIVEKCVEDARKHGSDVVAFGRWDVQENGQRKVQTIAAQTLVYCNDAVRKEFLPKLFTYEIGVGVSAWGKMYRLPVIREAGLRFLSEREIISEDAYFMLELLSEVETVSLIPQPLYFYYKRKASLSRVFRRDRQEKNDTFLTRCLQLVQQKNLPAPVSTHVKARYHMYTIAALKQTMASGLEEKEKCAALEAIFRSPVLRQTLTEEVLSLEKPAIRVFYYSLKLRQHWLCRLMLKWKLSKK